MDFGVFYRPEVNRILFHIAPDTGAAPCCYDTIVSESRIAYYVGIAKGDLPSRVYYGPWRTFPDTLRLRLAGDAAGRLHPHLRGPQRVRGLVSVRRHAARPELGRQHVRGADARAVRARGAMGPRQLAREPPAHRRRADRPRPERRRLRRLGLLVLEQPGRRLLRVRRRRRRHGPGRRPRRTTTARWSTAASPAARTARRGPDPPQSAYTNGVVTPHAAFLALRWRPGGGARRRSRALEDLGAYTPLGFYDAVNVDDRRAVARPTCRSTRG